MPGKKGWECADSSTALSGVSVRSLQKALDLLGEQKVLGMCGGEAAVELGQLRLEAGMLSREGTGSLKRKTQM